MMANNDNNPHNPHWISSNTLGMRSSPPPQVTTDSSDGQAPSWRPLHRGASSAWSTAGLVSQGQTHLPTIHLPSECLPSTYSGPDSVVSTGHAAEFNTDKIL